MDEKFVEMRVRPGYKWEKCKVVKKTYTTYFACNRWRTVYMLWGVRVDGRQATLFCNKERWDEYDVPVEETKVRSKEEKKAEHKINVELLACPKEKKEREKPKNCKRVYNEEIEKWLLEHNGIDFSNLLDKNLFGN